MKFKFEKLGYIDEGEVTPGNLTIIAGDNNKGKTYISYAIYSFLKNIAFSNTIKIDKSIIQELKQTGFAKIDISSYMKDIDKIFFDFSLSISKNIADFFNTNEEYFKDTKIDFEFKEFNCEYAEESKRIYLFGKNDNVRVEKQAFSSELNFYLHNDSGNQIPNGLLDDMMSRTISSIFFDKLIKKPFIITSERTGISLFYKELDFTKSNVLDLLSKQKKLRPYEILDAFKAKYAEPIKDNIDIVRNFENIQKKKSFIAKDFKDEFKELIKSINGIVDGSFKLTEKEILFQAKKEKNRNVAPIPFYITSSATKSIFLLDLYVKYIAQPNDILMIDEPELNLHPTKQIIMARFLTNLVNLGVDVMITTHSDFMIKEFNNLIMLSNNFSEKERIKKDYSYNDSDILSPEKVKAYYVNNHKIHPVEIDKYGMNFKLFDDTINKLNKRSDDIYYSLED